MHETTEPIHTADVHTRDVHTRRVRTVGIRRFSPSSILSLIVGVGFVVLGAVVLLRGDVSGAWSDPVVSALGLTHTPLLGLIEVGAGVLLILAGLANSRGLTMFVSVALIAFGAVVVMEHESLADDLAVTSAHGWWAIGIGAVLLATAIAVPTVRRTSVVEVADSSAIVDEPVAIVDEPVRWSDS